MRQAGVLAAAGIVAITEMVSRLEEDHLNAKKLAAGLGAFEGIGVHENKVKTNIVYLNIIQKDLTAEDLSMALDAEGVRLLATAPKQLRAVTNYHVEADDIGYVLEILAKVMNK
jgi:threonine aldolase